MFSALDCSPHLAMWLCVEEKVEGNVRKVPGCAPLVSSVWVCVGLCLCSLACDSGL